MAAPKFSSSIKKYNDLMNDFREAKELARNPAFQRKFNGYYRMGRMKKYNPNYMSIFFKILEEYRDNKNGRNKDNITFEGVLRELHREANVFTPSFASKLVATVNDQMPVWDFFVKQYCNVSHPPKYNNDEKRYKKAQEGYQKIEKELKSHANDLLKEFDIACQNNGITKDDVSSISTMKKIDFAVWLLHREKQINKRKK